MEEEGFFSIHSGQYYTPARNRDSQSALPVSRYSALVTNLFLKSLENSSMEAKRRPPCQAYPRGLEFKGSPLASSSHKNKKKGARFPFTHKYVLIVIANSDLVLRWCKLAKVMGDSFFVARESGIAAHQHDIGIKHSLDLY